MVRAWKPDSPIWVIWRRDSIDTGLHRARTLARFSVALPRPQKPSGLLRTGSPGRPPRLLHSSWALYTCSWKPGQLNTVAEPSRGHPISWWVIVTCYSFGAHTQSSPEFKTSADSRPTTSPSDETVQTEVPRVEIHAKRSHTRVKNPVVHFRVQPVTYGSTNKPACTKNTPSAVSLLESGEQRYIKAINSNSRHSAHLNAGVILLVTVQLAIGM